MAYDTTMDYLFTTTKDFTRKLSQQKNKATPLVSFIDLAKEKSADSSIFLGMSNDSKDKEKIKRFARNTRLEIENLRIEMSHSYGDEKYQYMQGISENYQALIDYVSKKLKNYHILRSILLDIDQNYSSADKDDKKFLWTLFEALCLEKNRLLYAAISKVSVSEMYDLVPDDSGSIEIYGIKHSKNAVKNVKF